MLMLISVNHCYGTTLSAMSAAATRPYRKFHLQCIVRHRRPHKHATNHRNPPLYWISRGRLADRPACIISYRRRPVVTCGTVADSWHRASETKPWGSGLVPVTSEVYSHTLSLWLQAKRVVTERMYCFWLDVVWVKWSEFSLY